MSVKGPVVCTSTENRRIEDPLRALSVRNTTKPQHLWHSWYQTPNLVKDINVLLSVQEPSDDVTATKRMIQLFAEEIIHELSIQLLQKTFFSKKNWLIFGDASLLRKEDISAAPESESDPSSSSIATTSTSMSTNEALMENMEEESDFFHVLTKLSSIKQMRVVTAKQKSTLYKNEQEQEKHTKAPSEMSALTPKSLSLSKNVAADEEVSENRLVLRGCVLENENGLLSAPSSQKHENFEDGDPVVHLVIRKSTKVHWHHMKGDGFELRISAGDTVEQVKCKIEDITEGFQPSEHVFLKEGHTLHPSMSLSELGVKNGDILELVEIPLRLEEYPDPGSPMCGGSPKAVMSFEWEKAKDALAQGVRPKLTSAGTGGSYFISAPEGVNLAVFKPEDEEPLAPNNPKGHKGSTYETEGLKKGVRPGEGATREVIAYILDHEHFSGVPPTAMVSLSQMHNASAHRKVGSFQQFVQHDMDCEEMGPSKFPVHEVHKICVLDIRLANADRNGGNILARHEQGEWHLTPIDHGYCLPDSFEDIDFEWMNWKQAKVPFEKKTSEYIARLDAHRDLEILAKNGLCLRPGCARVFHVCTMLLKKAVLYGLTPYQIGMIMCRQTRKMTPLEKIHKRAIHLTLSKMYGDHSKILQNCENLEIDEKIYLKIMSSLLDQYMEETKSTAETTV